MRIAIAGATGRTGRLILQHALSRGHHVCALSRREVESTEDHHLSWVVGDADDLNSLESLIDGCDAVISAIGPRPDHPRACSTATANLVAAGATRLVVISGMGVTLPGDNKSIIDRTASLMVRLMAPQVFADKVTELGILQQSKIDWTAVRVGALTDDQEVKPLEADAHRPPGFAINTGSLAAFCVSEVEEPRFVREAPFVSF